MFSHVDRREYGPNLDVSFNARLEGKVGTFPGLSVIILSTRDPLLLLSSSELLTLSFFFIPSYYSLVLGELEVCRYFFTEARDLGRDLDTLLIFSDQIKELMKP